MPIVSPVVCQDSIPRLDDGRAACEPWRAMSLVLAVLGALRAALKTRTDLTLENLALRQQLALLRLSFAKTRSGDWTRGERRASHAEECPSSLFCWVPCARRSEPAPTSRSRTWRSGNNSPCSAATRSDHNLGALIEPSGCGSPLGGLGGTRP